MKVYVISKRDVIIFFIVTFGLTILMGIAMSMIYTEHPIDFFVLLQMYYPAMGVMIALMSNKERRKELPMKFFGTYLFFSITSVLYLILQTFIFNGDTGKYLVYWMGIGSIILFFIYITERNEKMITAGMRMSKNWKISILYIVLFIILYIMRFSSEFLILGAEAKDIFAPLINPEVWRDILLLFSNFIVNIIPFLGEELGWRYFLQPVLQEKMGKRKGVIVLGFIWGLWHLPVNLFFHSHTMFPYSVLNQLTVCISHSIFMGLVYMKTENIWVISFIHYINNNLSGVIYSEIKGLNYITGWQSFLLGLMYFCLFHLPFLWSKEYKENKELERIEANF